VVDDSGYTRRDILEISGASLAAITGTTSLAGCSTDDGETNSTPEENDNGTMPDSTPTGTETPTPEPDPEITILDENGDKYGEDPELSDSILTLDFGPTDSFESLNMYLESRDHPLNEFEHVLFDSEEQGIPKEEGKAKAKIPYRDIWEEQRKYIQELFQDDNTEVSWRDMKQLWEDAGGPVNIVAEAETGEETLTQTLPAELLHPKRTADLEQHNQRIDLLTQSIPQGEEYKFQVWFDYKLTRKIRGPYVKDEWGEPDYGMGPITNENVIAQGKFSIPGNGGDRGYQFIIDNDPEEVTEFLNEIGKVDERNGMDIYHNVWEDGSPVASYAFDPETGLFFYGLAYPDSGSDPKDLYLERMIDAWAGDEDTMAEAEFMDNPRVRNALKPGIMIGPGIDLGYKSIPGDLNALQMIEFYPENTEDILGEEHPERYSNPGTWVQLFDLDADLEEKGSRPVSYNGWKKFYDED